MADRVAAMLTKLILSAEREPR